MILTRSNIYTLSHAPSLSHSQKPNATTLLIGWLLGCAAEFAIVSGFLYIFLKLIYLNGATFFELTPIWIDIFYNFIRVFSSVSTSMAVALVAIILQCTARKVF